MDSVSLPRQGRYGLQEVVSEIQEIARSSEKLVEINSLMMNIASQANFLSLKAVEAIRSGNVDNGLAIVAHEAYKLAEFSNEQTKANWHMFTEIKESIGKINGSINKVLNSFGEVTQSCGSIPALRAAGIGQVNKAAEVVTELARMNENISFLLQSVSRLKI